VARILWSVVAVVAGIYSMRGVWERVATRAWQRLPAWHWGVEFELRAQRDTFRSMLFAMAIVFLTKASLELLRITKTGDST
jgi:Na+/melibiose symporter-like transporter